jgi:SAM-dependent methyltransferase
MKFYPYLRAYVTNEKLAGCRVLEIGLGYGTLGQIIAMQGCQYFGLDIAVTPVSMMQYRITRLHQNAKQVQQGSALDIPYPDASFDYVYSIGCLHHTGNLNRSIGEIYRILKPGGKAIVMLYHRHSFRQMIAPIRRLFSRKLRADYARGLRGMYDRDSKGTVAPYTDYVSRAEVRQLFGAFSKLQIDCQNFDTYTLFRRLPIPRQLWLNNIARVVGLDLYVVARK